MIKLLFTGDFSTIGCLDDMERINTMTPFSMEVLNFFRSTDLNITNLETPLTLSSSKILKSGPHLKASPATIKWLNDLRLDIACLSNNHIRDYGEKGVIDTIDSCIKADLKTLGAGKTLKDASKPLIVEVRKKKIGFLNFSESEFNYATDTRAGSNPDDIIHIVSSIREIRKEVDYLIVIMHGGKEMHPQPTPYQMRLFRFVVDQGANAVIGHHTHVIGGYEIYKDVPIVYSLGNFFFDESGNPKSWYVGSIAILDIDELENKVKVSFRYVELQNCKLELLMPSIKKYEMKVVDDITVHNYWRELVEKQHLGTIKSLLNLSLPERILLKTRIIKLNEYKKKLIPLGNRLRCKTHQLFSIDSIDHFINKL